MTVDREEQISPTDQDLARAPQPPSALQVKRILRHLVLLSLAPPGANRDGVEVAEAEHGHVGYAAIIADREIDEAGKLRFEFVRINHAAIIPRTLFRQLK